MNKSLGSVGMLALAVATAACASQTPTSPTRTAGMSTPSVVRSESDGGTSVLLEMRALAGRVINLLTGGPAAGVTLHIEGVGDVAADAAGQFNLESEAPDGQYRVTASAAGFVTRQTGLTFPGQVPAISLIPITFNMTAFDQMVRQFGEPLGVTKRWTTAPALVIETSLVDPQSVIGGIPQYPPVASAEQLTEAEINEVVGQLAAALPRITSNNFPAFVTIDRSTTAPGANIEMDRPGAITVVKYRGLDQLCRGFTYFLYDTLTLSALNSRLFLQTCSATATAKPPAFVVAHELGHALGYGHVAGVTSVMTAVIDSDVTDFDRQAAAILFQRAPGNQAPDVDPDVTVNLPVPVPQRFGGRVRVAGPIE